MTNRVTPLDDNIYIRVKQKEKQMKQFNVLAVVPVTRKEVTFRNVDAKDLFHNEHGETYFRYNRLVNWEVITATEIPQEKLDAELAYFTKYGTKGE